MHRARDGSKQRLPVERTAVHRRGLTHHGRQRVRTQRWLPGQSCEGLRTSIIHLGHWLQILLQVRPNHPKHGDEHFLPATTTFAGSGSPSSGLSSAQLWVAGSTSSRSDSSFHPPRKTTKPSLLEEPSHRKPLPRPPISDMPCRNKSSRLLRLRILLCP